MDLALHHLTALDTDPVTLVDLAADTGCTGVCLFVASPETPLSGGNVDLSFPAVTEAMLPEVSRRLADRNVRVCNVEYFPLDSNPPFDRFRKGMAIGNALGARMAVTHIHDPEPSRAAENLARLADLAAEHGLDVGLEFMPLSPACPSVHRAADYVRAAGRRNVRIGVDALHLARSGGTPADIARIDPQLIGYAQLCDGPVGVSADYLAEALDRQIAGHGSFPLVALAQALPSHTIYDVETPLPGLAGKGVSARERTRLAVDGARLVLAAARHTIEPQQ